MTAGQDAVPGETFPRHPADPEVLHGPPPPRRGPGRLARLLLWADRMGWKLNAVLLLATLVSTTLFSEAPLLAFDPEAPFAHPWRMLASGLTYGFSVMAILGAHELGHYLACRWYGVSATLPFFLPAPPLVLTGTFGAVIRIREPIPNRRALFDIGIAGPLAGFVVLLPVLAIGLATAQVAAPLADVPGVMILTDAPLSILMRNLLYGPLPPGTELQLNPFLLAAWLGMLATAMNLFPVGQLDGGHVCYALSRRLHRGASRVTVLALAGFLVYGLAYYGSPIWLLWVVVLAWMGPRHPPLLDESGTLSVGRRIVAIIGLIVLVLCFTPVPIYLL